MRIHVVQKGDTLEKIAKRYEVGHDALKKMNAQLTSPDSLKPGMKVKVPTGGVPVRKAKPDREPSKTRNEAPKKMPKKEAPKKKPAEYEEKDKKSATTVAASYPGQTTKMEWPGGVPGSNQGNAPTENWSFHYPVDELPENWGMNEAPQLGAMNYGPNMHPQANMPEYPNPMQYGPGSGAMYPEAVSPASYGPIPNAMYPQQVSPANYGTPPESMSGGYGPSMYPEAPPYNPWANANPMYPENVSPAQYQPNMMPNAVHPLNTIPAGSPCGCGAPMYGYPQGPTPYMPPMPQAPMVSPQMGSKYQPGYWEPNNTGFYGMMPAGARSDSNDEDS